MRLADLAVFHGPLSLPPPPSLSLSLSQVMAATDEQYESLERFFSTNRLAQGGFPVKFSLPVLPAVSALVTFEKCELTSPDEKLFEIPADYKEGGFRNFLERNKIQ